MGISVLKVEWKGKSGTINAQEAFRAADAVEEHVTIYQLAEMMGRPETLRVGKLAAAYATLCKKAGVPADAGEIRSELAAQMAGAMRGEDGTLAKVFGVIGPLYTLLTDGANAIEASPEQGEPEGNVETPAS